MALPITIFKNILDFNCMHIEKAEIETREIHAYGGVWDQDIVVISARLFKRAHCCCPVCKNKCVKDGFKQEAESTWMAPNLNGMPVFIKYRPQRILCTEHGALNEHVPWADGSSKQVHWSIQ